MEAIMIKKFFQKKINSIAEESIIKEAQQKAERIAERI